MLECIALLTALKNDRRGVTAVEYGLIAAFMSAVLVIIFGTTGTFTGALQTAFTNIGTNLTAP